MAKVSDRVPASTGRAGVFGADSFRFGNAAIYLWEDFLGIGLLLALVGLVHIGRVNRKLLAGMLAWILPSALLATLFRIEGQQDYWLVASWLPLHLAVAVGLAQIPSLKIRHGLEITAVLGLFWAIGVNQKTVSMRSDTLAEEFGRYHLDNLDRDAILILESDDALSTTQYLQVVKGLRSDVVVASASRFGSGWYEAHLQRRHPRLKGGDTVKAFVEANAASPIYFEAVASRIRPRESRPGRPAAATGTRRAGGLEIPGLPGGRPRALWTRTRDPSAAPAGRPGRHPPNPTSSAG